MNETIKKNRLRRLATLERRIKTTFESLTIILINTKTRNKKYSKLRQQIRELKISLAKEYTKIIKEIESLENT